MEVNSCKKQLRANYRRDINKLTLEEVCQKSSIICHRALSLPFLSEVKTIGSYASYGNEVSTCDLLIQLLERGFCLALPMVNSQEHTMEFGMVEKLTELAPGAFGIMEPRNSRCCHPGEIDLFFIPGLAFDYQGNRLGRGGGYYDRYLSNVRADALKIGLAYQLQLVTELPVNSDDVKMDFIITEEKIITLRNYRSD